MVLLLGAGGFVGRAFAAAMVRQGRDFIPLSRRALDYTRFDVLFDFVRRTRPRFLINAAGMTGRPDEASCDAAREETLAANTLLPQTIARVCRLTGTPWGHVSSACIFRGAKIAGANGNNIETELRSAVFRRRLAMAPETISGFTEADEPNCSFRRPPCSFYVGAKALGEEALAGARQLYIWRPGVVFNHQPVARNLLWRLLTRGAVADAIQPLSHVDDFARACLTLWQSEAPYGIYHVVNPGVVTTGQILRILRERGACDAVAGPERRQNERRDADRHDALPDGVIDTQKLETAGVRLRTAAEALDAAVREWSGPKHELQAHASVL